MILQETPPPSPLPGAVLILAICGAIADWRYRRKGGRKSSKRDKILFLIAVASVGVLFATFWFLGGSEGAGPAIQADVLIPLVVVLFGTWELGRWRVRRKYPPSVLLAAPTVLDVSALDISPPGKFCPRCGHEREASAKFCPECGNVFALQERKS